VLGTTLVSSWYKNSFLFTFHAYLNILVFMKAVTLILTVLLLSSCSNQTDSNSRYVSIETADLKGVYDSFSDEARSRGVAFTRFETLTITIEDDIGFNAGICSEHTEREFDKQKLQYIIKKKLTVKMSKANWEGSSPEQKEILLFHELGHCLLGKPHRNDIELSFEGSNYPSSIMFARVLAILPRAYEAHRAYYIDELFR